MIGGMFMVLRHTGIIEIGVDKLTRRFARQSLLTIPVLMTVFASHRDRYRHPGAGAGLRPGNPATDDCITL